MRRPKAGAGERLAAALLAAVPPFAGEVEAVATDWRTWTSITFTGERHTLRLKLSGEGADAAADALLGTLAEPELDLRGHLLVDLAVTDEQRNESGDRVSLTFSAVTVEAACRRWQDPASCSR